MSMINTYQVLVLVVLLLAPVAICSVENAKKIIDNKASLETLYKKVVDDLVEVRKVHPVSQQSKVYSILDQLDSIHTAAQQTFDRENALKEVIKKKDDEIVALQQDMLLMKSYQDGVQQKLNAAYKKLDAEKKQSKLFAEEKKMLEKKIGTLQTMNITTTNDQLLLDKHEKGEGK